MSILVNSYGFTGDCSNTSIGAVIFNVTGTTPPFAVTCLNSSLPPTSALTAPFYSYEATGLSGDTYFLQIIDGASNGTILSVYISSGTSASIDSTNTTCGFDNGSVTGFTSGVYGYASFTLYDGSDNYITSASTSNSYYDFQSLSAGTYYVVADDGGGCTGITASVIINPSNAFTYSGYVVNDGSCIGTPSGKIFLTGLTLPVSAYSINWLTNVNGQTGATITGLTSGSYVVEITNPDSCVTSNTFTVQSVDPIGSAGFIVFNQPSCFQNDGSVEFIVSGGTAPYFFSASTGQVEITFDQSAIFTNLASGTYNFSVTDAGLCTIYDSISLITPNSFNTVQVNTTPSYCSVNDGTIQVIVDNGFSNQANLLITISGQSGTQQIGTLGNSIQTFFGLPNDTYLVTVSTVGCVYTATTSVSSVNLYTVTAATTGTTCGSKNGTLQVTVSTGGTLPYIFTLVGPSQNPGTITTAISTFSNLDYGNYVLTVQDSSTPNCIQSYAIYIDQSQNVFFNYITSQPINGNDGSISSYITQGEPPFTYTWTGGNAASQTGNTATGLTSGIYTLTVTDSDGCTLIKQMRLSGTVKYADYRYFNICQDNFQDSGFIGPRNIRSMYLEGYADLTSGDTNCIINGATFSIFAEVGSQSAQTIFYTSSGSTDYPSDVLWAQTITDTLDSFVGISGTTVDITNNRIEIQTTCQDVPKGCIVEPINPLQDTQVIVNLVIDYDIACVLCTLCTDPFISVWTTTSPSETINLPYSPSGIYDGTIDWGDGSPISVNSYANRFHTYASVGTYTITINGEITNFNFGVNDPTNVTNLISVTQWGSCFNIVSGLGAFENCSFLTLTGVTDILDLTNVLTTQNMFDSCTQLTTVNNMDSWDVSSVLDMNGMFAGCTNFNQPLNSWVVSSVTDMGNMFTNCSVFNLPLNSWDVSSVTDMGNMFTNCSVFNLPLNSWDVSSVFNMSYMFTNCFDFNQPLNSWDVSSVTNMEAMFYQCLVFDQPLNSWIVSSVTNMSFMFNSCIVFNLPLNSWDVSSVTNMSYMFEQCYQFNQPLNSWIVSSVTNMNHMFNSCFAFDKDISSWDVSSVVNMDGMFFACVVFNQNLNTWCVQNIPSLPTNFDFGATSWILPKPIWGITSSPPC